MTTIINKATIKHEQEQNFVNGIIELVEKQGFDLIQIVRSPKSFGAQAKPYKVSKRNGKSLFKLNLGSCYPCYFDGVDYHSNYFTQDVSNFYPAAYPTQGE